MAAEYRTLAGAAIVCRKRTAPSDPDTAARRTGHAEVVEALRAKGTSAGSNAGRVTAWRTPACKAAKTTARTLWGEHVLARKRWASTSRNGRAKTSALNAMQTPISSPTHYRAARAERRNEDQLTRWHYECTRARGQISMSGILKNPHPKRRVRVKLNSRLVCQPRRRARPAHIDNRYRRRAQGLPALFDTKCGAHRSSTPQRWLNTTTTAISPCVTSGEPSGRAAEANRWRR